MQAPRRDCKSRAVLPVPVWPPGVVAWCVHGEVEWALPVQRALLASCPPPSAQQTAVWSWMQAGGQGWLQAGCGLPLACCGPLPKQDGQIISDVMSRVIQAIVFSVMAMNKKGCFNMDISWGNLAICEIDGILYAVLLEIGEGVAMPKPNQGGGGNTNAQCSTTVAAGPDAGQSKDLKTPTFSVNKETGIGYLC